MPQQIHPTQLDWMVSTNRNPPTTPSSRHDDGDDDDDKDTDLLPLPPVIAFAHIPTIDFDVVANDNPSCRGERSEPIIMNVSYDAGLEVTLQNMGNVHFLAVGHMHGNDDCCPTRTRTTPSSSSNTSTTSTSSSSSSSLLNLCFGRHSGYGGYGHWERGARVYELTLTDDLQFSWTSYVRMESGEIQHAYVPPPPTPPP